MKIQEIWPVVNIMILMTCKRLKLNQILFIPSKYMFSQNLRWLAHLVSQFACNTRVIVDASSSTPVSHIKITVTKA